MNVSHNMFSRYTKLYFFIISYNRGNLLAIISSGNNAEQIILSNIIQKQETILYPNY